MIEAQMKAAWMQGMSFAQLAEEWKTDSRSVEVLLTAKSRKDRQAAYIKVRADFEAAEARDIRPGWSPD
jgi:hypothetical protein